MTRDEAVALLGKYNGAVNRLQWATRWSYPEEDIENYAERVRKLEAELLDAMIRPRRKASA